jgi:hypothetical protein
MQSIKLQKAVCHVSSYVRLPTTDKFAANTMARVHIVRSIQVALRALGLLLCLYHSIAQAQSGKTQVYVPHQHHDSRTASVGTADDCLSNSNMHYQTGIKPPDILMYEQSCGCSCMVSTATRVQDASNHLLLHTVPRTCCRPGAARGSNNATRANHMDHGAHEACGEHYGRAESAYQRA